MGSIVFSVALKQGKAGPWRHIFLLRDLATPHPPHPAIPCQRGHLPHREADLLVGTVALGERAFKVIPSEPPSPFCSGRDQSSPGRLEQGLLSPGWGILGGRDPQGHPGLCLALNPPWGVLAGRGAEGTPAPQDLGLPPSSMGFLVAQLVKNPCNTEKAPTGRPFCDPSSWMGAAPHLGATAVSR